MLKLAILKKVRAENGQIFYKPILEGEDGEFERELASRIKRILGPKKSFNAREVSNAIERAFKEYQTEFKEKTVKLP
jgi:hypothetical protein